VSGQFERGPADALRQSIHIGGAQTCWRIVVITEMLVHFPVLLKGAEAAWNGATEMRRRAVSLADGVENWGFL
jgi:hypothetical protein